MRSRFIASICVRLIAVAVVASPWLVKAADEQPEGGTAVLVLPFAAINPAEAQPWLGKSIQQSVVADLGTAAPGRVIADDREAADDAAALDMARKAGAACVVRGSFATVEGDLRVTGQALDANTGKPVAAIKATGPAASVFAMEDQLASQIRRRLKLDAGHTPGSVAPSEAIPPMEPLRISTAQQSADPYVQAYVTVVPGPARQSLDYDYYLSQPADWGYAMAGWCGFGLGWGCGFNYYGCSTGFCGGFRGSVYGGGGRCANQWGGGAYGSSAHVSAARSGAGARGHR